MEDNEVKNENEQVTNNQPAEAPKVENVEQVQETNKFESKAINQVNKVLKEINSLGEQGGKSDLTDEEINNIISEVRDTTNTIKKQFEKSLEKKDTVKFGTLNQPVNKTVKEIKSLGDLAEKHSGEFNESHIKQIFDSLKKKTSELKKQLKNNDKKDDGFSF